jgi:hypothetical protein
VIVHARRIDLKKDRGRIGVDAREPIAFDASYCVFRRLILSI